MCLGRHKAASQPAMVSHLRAFTRAGLWPLEKDSDGCGTMAAGDCQWFRICDRRRMIPIKQKAKIE